MIGNLVIESEVCRQNDTTFWRKSAVSYHLDIAKSMRLKHIKTIPSMSRLRALHSKAFRLMEFISIITATEYMHRIQGLRQKNFSVVKMTVESRLSEFYCCTLLFIKRHTQSLRYL